MLVAPSRTGDCTGLLASFDFFFLLLGEAVGEALAESDDGECGATTAAKAAADCDDDTEAAAAAEAEEAEEDEEDATEGESEKRTDGDPGGRREAAAEKADGLVESSPPLPPPPIACGNSAAEEDAADAVAVSTGKSAASESEVTSVDRSLRPPLEAAAAGLMVDFGLDWPALPPLPPPPLVLSAAGDCGCD